MSLRVCPLCDSPSRIRFIKSSIPILDCLTCGHRFADYRPAGDHLAGVYGDEYFSGGGAGYPDYLAEASLLRQHGRRYVRLLERFTRPGRVLDIGAAAGFILKAFVDGGWIGEGIEPNAAMSDHARERLGLTVHTGTLETVELEAQFDMVNFIQVVAHFPDPLAAFEIANRATKPGGLWLVETWDRDSLTARLFGESWHEYSPPSVLHWFTPRVLRATLARLGYRQLAVGKPQKWLGAGHAKSLLQYKAAEGGAAKVLSRIASLVPDSLAVPYPSEDLFWGVYRKEDASSKRR